MAHPNEDLVRKGYDAFSTGDMDVLGKLMSADVVHSVPGNNLTSGEYEGQEAVFGMYGNLFELTEGTLQTEVQEVTADGDEKVIAKHRSTAKRGGSSLDVVQTLVFTIADGQIARLDETSGDLAAEDAFWV